MAALGDLGVLETLDFLLGGGEEDDETNSDVSISLLDTSTQRRLLETEFENEMTQQGNDVTTTMDNQIPMSMTQDDDTIVEDIHMPSLDTMTDSNDVAMSTQQDIKMTEDVHVAQNVLDDRTPEMSDVLMTQPDMSNVLMPQDMSIPILSNNDVTMMTQPESRGSEEDSDVQDVQDVTDVRMTVMSDIRMSQGMSMSMSMPMTGQQPERETLLDNGENHRDEISESVNTFKECRPTQTGDTRQQHHEYNRPENGQKEVHYHYHYHYCCSNNEHGRGHQMNGQMAGDGWGRPPDWGWTGVGQQNPGTANFGRRLGEQDRETVIRRVGA